MKKSRWLTQNEALRIGFVVKKNEKGRNNARYNLDEAQWEALKDFRSTENLVESKTATPSYKEKFVLSAWNMQEGKMMCIDAYCEKYSLPRKDITSYKLVSHTGTPFYNIVFKENLESSSIDFDIEEIVKKHIKPIKTKNVKVFNCTNDFDSLTYTDVHVGMETNADNNSMYAVKWNKEEIIKTAHLMVEKTLVQQSSTIIYID